MKNFIKIFFLMCLLPSMIKAECVDPLIRGRKIDHLTSLSPYYELSFTLRPYRVLPGWKSVIHVTKGGDQAVYGDRNPAVWFYPGGTKLQIYSSISGNKVKTWQSAPLPLHCVTKVQITQKMLANNKIYFLVYLNGTQVYSVENTQPMFFRNMTVYGSNPWHEPAAVMLQNYKLKDHRCD